MLSGLMGALAAEIKLTPVYIIGDLFQIGIPLKDAPPSTSCVFLEKGYCYGFPYVPTEFEIPILKSAKKIIQVRDPRDMLVSLYFSLRFSHPNPGSSAQGLKTQMTEIPGRSEAQALGIDDFIIDHSLRFINYSDILQKYKEISQLPDAKLFRYEDIVYDKITWAHEICDHFGWNISTDRLHSAVAQVDLFPTEEKPSDHVRQVHPGNYRKRLQERTIRWIEESCKEQMLFFGYEADLR
jgi:hypothetical protein